MLWPASRAARSTRINQRAHAMANAHELARGHKRLRALIDFAIAEGWHVKRTSGGHLKFTKAGYAPIYTSTTASDHRASLNAQADRKSTRLNSSHSCAARMPSSA